MNKIILILQRKKLVLLIILMGTIVLGVILYTLPNQPNITDFVQQETVLEISEQELERNWYWGNKNQKKTGTPKDWIYREAGRSSCWHKPKVDCNFSH